jgi:NAD(P)-dependent dehydrogenase (short-subunit alcohol dehydrogenase family)
MSQAYLSQLFGLAGKCALVTGARQGIGCAIAIALSRVGANVVVAGRTESDVSDTVAEVRRTGGQAVGIGFDVARSTEVDGAIARALEAYGRLDIVINNAGITARTPAISLSESDWNAVIATNLTGTFLVSRAAARTMTATGGRIVNLSSTFARVPFPGRAAYAASKAGVEQLTRVLALEWAPGITVNAIAPSTIVTETRAALFQDAAAREARVAEIPMGRLGTTDDLIGTVLLLCGPAGAFITGQSIVVDGGFSLG